MKGLLKIALQQPIKAPNEPRIVSGRGNVQKSSSSKAAAILARGAYSQYVSTAKGRERRWRLFSTFPLRHRKNPSPPFHGGEGKSEGVLTTG